MTRKTNFGKGVHPRHRPESNTRLGDWMAEKGHTFYSLAKELGLDVKTLTFWVRGQCLPPLVWAFKIEKFTAGEVAAASWLATELATVRWKTEGTEATQ